MRQYDSLSTMSAWSVWVLEKMPNCVTEKCEFGNYLRLRLPYLPRGVQIRVWLNNAIPGEIWSVGPNFDILNNSVFIVDKKMYPLIWVNWVLVELLIKNYQNLKFYGGDWVFSILECTREKCQTAMVLTSLGSSAAIQKNSLNTLSK